MDRILINDLRVRCIIGAWPAERREKQDVIINIVLWTDLSKAAKSDSMKNALDYRRIKKRILRLVENSKFHLIEALADAIASACLEDKQVLEVQVRVEKPAALRFARTVGVEIQRSRRK